MKVVCVGGGPAGLYLAILLKKADPAHDLIVLERNRPGDTFGFGVVFSDATLGELADADPPTYEAITRHFYHWDDIDVHYHGEVLRSHGHGFSGLARKTLLQILCARCEELGVDLRFETEVEGLEAFADADLIAGADGVNSTVRELYAEQFGVSIDHRPNRFVWLGTTRPFPAFTFYFRQSEHGLWRAHCYQYETCGHAAARLAIPDITAASRVAAPAAAGAAGHSTFIVEATEETWSAAGMDAADEEETAAFLEGLFAEELEGHSLIRNRSVWRSFPTVRTSCWSRGNVVILGDAAHTAHFSVGSGTRMAMIDAIELARALGEHRDLQAALEAYEEVRRPAVESLQRAAQASLEWFEDTERYMDLEPTQFAFNILTRSLRITHSNLRERDPEFIDRVDRWFAAKAEAQSGESPLRSGKGVPLGRGDPPPPPLFTPFRLREMRLRNRAVVSPMCQYLAEDGMPDDWHLVHLGSRAIGGAALVWTEMTDVSREARISPGCAGLYKPEHVAGWRRIVDFIHRHTYARIGMQLGHAGRKGATRLPWEGMDEPLGEGEWPLISASPIPYFDHSQVPREMERNDMDAVRDDFVRAARLADEAGFDILEVHFAHGYLLASFVSPLTNIRTDGYGGSLENRLRFPLEVFDAVREVWPAEKPMSVRISAVDWAPGGTQPADAVRIARMLKEHACDIVDVSAGQTVPYAKPRYGRQFQTPFSDRIRHEVGIPTMAVGNISSYMDVNSILAAGRADLCLLARAHLWDPYWTRHSAFELGYDLPWPGPYATLDSYTPRFE